MPMNTVTYGIVDREIKIPLNVDTFGVVGDENSKVLHFKTSRYVDSVDLTTKQVYVCFKNANSQTGEKLAENIQYTSKLLMFDWVVPAKLTSYSGQIELYVEFRELDEEYSKIYVMRTTPITRDIKKSFDIYNNATEADYDILDRFISQNPDRIDFKDLIDSDIPFRVIDRDIKFDQSKVVAVQKDNFSQIMTFRLKRFVDNIDRSTMHFTFHFINADKETGITTGCNIVYNADEVFVGWPLDSRVTKTAGNITFKIHINGELDNGETYRWNTFENSFNVTKSFDAVNDIEIPTTDWFVSWEKAMDNAIGQAASYANQAKEYYNKMLVEFDPDNPDAPDLPDITDQINELKKDVKAIKDNANLLSSIYSVRKTKDANGVFTVVEYFRPDNTLYMRSTLQEDTVGSLHYANRLEQLFDVDGTTEKSSITLPIVYDTDGIVTGKFNSMNQLLYHFPGKESSSGTPINKATNADIDEMFE